MFESLVGYFQRELEFFGGGEVGGEVGHPGVAGGVGGFAAGEEDEAVGADEVADFAEFGEVGHGWGGG